MFCASRDTSQTGIIFSFMSVIVYFCSRKVHQKFKSCAASGWHNAPDEEGKERQWEICQKLVVHPHLMCTLTAESSWAELRWEKPPSTAESTDPCVNGECTRSHCTQKPDLSGLTQVFWPVEKGFYTGTAGGDTCPAHSYFNGESFSYRGSNINRCNTIQQFI